MHLCKVCRGQARAQVQTVHVLTHDIPQRSALLERNECLYAGGGFGLR